MKNSSFTLCFLIVIFLSILGAAEANAQSGRLFTVNNAADTNDSTVGDGLCADGGGNCTLRAAIEEANSTVVQDAVSFALPAGSTIDLTLGELAITSNIYIAGPGARKLTVQRSQAAGTADFRIFRIEYAVNSQIPVTVRGMTIKNGKTASDGGAVFIYYQTNVQLAEVAITNNTAAGSGGGVFNAGSLSLTRSLISSNTSNGLYGGGLVNLDSATALVVNSTFTGNSGARGGAIFNLGNLNLVNDTIAGNTASVNGSGVVSFDAANTKVLNTIIGMDASAPVASVSGIFNSRGNNIITDARTSTGFFNGVNGDQVSDNNAINPLLGDLADNGGQTDTRALLTNSPAIDHGNSCVFRRNCSAPLQNLLLFSDQRSDHLRQGGTTVDVGAYEASTFTMNGNGLLGIFSSPRAAGSLVVVTRPSNNEKRYGLVRQMGGVTVSNLQGREVYIIEIKSKRAGLSSLLVFDPEQFFLVLTGASTIEQNGVKLSLIK